VTRDGRVQHLLLDRNTWYTQSEDKSSVDAWPIISHAFDQADTRAVCLRQRCYLDLAIARRVAAFSIYLARARDPTWTTEFFKRGIRYSRLNVRETRFGKRAVKRSKESHVAAAFQQDHVSILISLESFNLQHLNELTRRQEPRCTDVPMRRDEAWSIGRRFAMQQRESDKIPNECGADESWTVASERRIAKC
jgi:hypothetical protein